ncbi:MAG TPA: hypothetical protein ENG99_00115 [bacterium]|nr:hypothetical protein [bacterium]
MVQFPQPEYLNLEWWFNKFFELLKAIPFLILEFLEWLGKFNPRLISMIISLLLAGGIIFVVYKIIYLQRKKIPSYLDFFSGEELPETRSARWDEIKRHLDSDNPIEWKMAVIEADSLLDDIMKRIGYSGEGLAERLKSIEPSDFDNLQNVWEAHKIRNRLVHEPAKFEFSKNDADETIEKYEEALKELKYI